MSSASADPKLRDDKKRSNLSFMANIFKGEVESKEIFPYPDVIPAERKEFVNTLIDPFEKFFLVRNYILLSCNNIYKNIKIVTYLGN